MTFDKITIEEDIELAEKGIALILNDGIVAGMEELE